MSGPIEESAIVSQLAIGQARTDTKLDEILRRLDKREDLETKVDRNIEQHRKETETRIERARDELDQLKSRVNMLSGGIAILAFVAPILFKKLGL